jgi:hypothetical protein
MAKTSSQRPKPPPEADAEIMARLVHLGSIQCDLAQVAHSFGWTERELNLFFKRNDKARAAYENAAAETLEQLRAAQFKLAQKSPTMAIFLGKHYLGQGERRELDQSAEVRAAEAAERVRRKLDGLLAGRESAGGPKGGEEL